jgi:nucleotide-binding universal stress UspA family protein
VGTHGYGRVAGLLLGSVTQGLLHSGVCPVLAVPTGAPAEAPGRELETATAK